MKTITDKKRIEEIFARGTVVEVLPSRDELIARMMTGEPIRLYIGLDATSSALHLAHARILIFLEELRQLGHQIIILFGDFTAQIGDPTDKSMARKQLTHEDVKRNVAGWLDQIKPLIDINDPKNPTLIKYNSDWLSKLTFTDVVNLASNFTVQQMLERDMFQKRLKENTPIHLHEFLYPLMQGYDSVAMEVDAEVCGTDQIFNAMAGRTLLKRLKDKDKFVVALNLMANPKTGALMSKSKGTGVFLNQTSEQLFGSIMSQPDEMIEPFFVNCTRIPLSEKDALMSKGPRDAKAAIAFDIVKRFHGEAAAKLAQEAFENTFAKGGVPEDVEEVIFSKDSVLSEALVKLGAVPSKAEWRRLVLNGAVRLEDDSKITDPSFAPDKTMILKIGKRRFVRVVVK